MAEIELFNGMKSFHARTRKQWRASLHKNHASEKSVWLIMYGKESKTPGIRYDEAVEEALCFGWIDSKAVRRDDESRYQYFTQRKPASKWSKLNRERFDRNKKAFENFQKFSPSSQKIILRWIMDAKKPETRLTRIDETVRRAANNVKARP